MGLKEEELKIPYQGEELYGILYRPEEKKERAPLIIVSHVLITGDAVIAVKAAES